jgi:DNA-binding PadR family transcriptional regulator
LARSIVSTIEAGPETCTDMKLLTRSEEFVLLAVWKLQQDAYSLSIRDMLSEITGYEWSLGSVYTPLERLERKRLLRSSLSESTPERGGRKKRIYEVTSLGQQALLDIRTVQATMWDGVADLGLSPSGR